MTVHYGYEGVRLLRPVVTSGIFDGVHRGHKALLEVLVSRAREMQGESVAITFSPHPRLVLPGEGLKQVCLNTPAEKITLLEECHIDHLIILEFTAEFSRMGAEEFIGSILAGKFGTKHLVIGYDHHFGRDAGGDYEMIKRLAGASGFTVEQVEGVREDDSVISSSIIRGALLGGRLDEANRKLGYFYRLGGSVVKGRRLGRSLGFPTANIMPGDRHKLIPADGVYAVEVILGPATYPGMLSIGYNPTVSRGERKRSIEVHIINFEGNIYGREITILFRHRLRDEIRFETTEELKRQMELDRDWALRLLS